MIVAGSIGVVDGVSVLVRGLVVRVEFTVQRHQLEGQNDARQKYEEAEAKTEPDAVDWVQDLSTRKRNAIRTVCLCSLVAKTE